MTPSKVAKCKINVRVSVALRDTLQKLAEEKEETISQFLRTLVLDYKANKESESGLPKNAPGRPSDSVAAKDGKESYKLISGFLLTYQREYGANVEGYRAKYGGLQAHVEALYASKDYSALSALYAAACWLKPSLYK